MTHEHTRPSHHIADSERGIALVIALMAMTLMIALGAALMMTTTTESKIVNNYRNGSESLYAADAGLERALDDLLTVPDWNKLLDGTAKSALVDGAPSGVRVLSDGTQLNLTEVLNIANCQKVSNCSAADLLAVTNERPWGTNNPQWQLFAYGKANDILPQGINSPYYLIVMIGDDPSESDDDPLHDGVIPCKAGLTPPAQCNPGSSVLAMRAEAYGPRGTHKVIEVTIARTDTTELERGYTGQRGQDEQNRRARKAAVQSPGKALTNQALNVAAGGIS
jgi:Tfp pilus assembly protein PilX